MSDKQVRIPSVEVDFPYPCSVIQLTPDYAPLIGNMLEMVLNTKAQVILETGTNIGDSSRIWLEGLSKTGGELWTIDVKEYDNSWADGIKNIHFIRGSSTEIPWDKPIDILYLDSDHSYGHVTRELVKFGPYVKEGGAIVMNDTCHHECGWEVTQALRHFMLAAGLCHWTENVRGYGLAIVQVTKQIPHLHFP